jgi:hypothetical protein
VRELHDRSDCFEDNGRNSTRPIGVAGYIRFYLQLYSADETANADGESGFTLVFQNNSDYEIKQQRGGYAEIVVSNK